MTQVHTCEVAVIGGGAVGCSAALQLARRGKDVTLLDRATPGSGTSSKSYGLIWAQSKASIPYMEFCLSATALWPAWAASLEEDIGLRLGGGIQPCVSEEDYHVAENRIAKLSSSPRFRGRMLSREETRALQPGIAPDIAGSSWSEHDGDCDWERYAAALWRRCEREGVRIRPNTRVTGFEHSPGSRLRRVVTDRDTLRCDAAIIAAGVWSQEIAALAGIVLDVRPVRGQILVTESAPVTCPLPMSWVRQEREGRFFMGTTFEEVGFDSSTTAEAAQDIARRSASIVPQTQDLKVVRHFAGLRPMPRDGLPVLGEVRALPGLYLAVSHSGITLSPLHGKVLSDLIVDGQTSEAIAPYDPARFDPAARGAPR